MAPVCNYLTIVAENSDIYSAVLVLPVWHSGFKLPRSSASRTTNRLSAAQIITIINGSRTIINLSSAANLEVPVRQAMKVTYMNNYKMHNF